MRKTDKPTTPQHIKSLRGSLKGKNVLKELMADRTRARSSKTIGKVHDSP